MDRRSYSLTEDFRRPIAGVQMHFGGLYRDRVKRLLDVVLVLLLLPLAVPLVGLVSAMLALGGGGAFFGHQRIGLGGKAFRCWKLRTMVPDAEAALRAHLRANPAAAEEWLRHWKLAEDPRITRLGRFLRRTSLDELPQLLNVLRGEMSLVGPRPVTAAELAQYGPVARAYVSVRPGITGLWQVSGRNTLNPLDRIELDGRYVERLSLPEDLRILIRTAGAVAAGSC